MSGEGVTTLGSDCAAPMGSDGDEVGGSDELVVPVEVSGGSVEVSGGFVEISGGSVEVGGSGVPVSLAVVSPGEVNTGGFGELVSEAAGR